jgi:MFS transporter, DHA1 family, inner membrane transport protein
VPDIARISDLCALLNDWLVFALKLKRRRMNRKEWMILAILAGLNFTHILDFMIMMPLGNFLMPHFNISAQFFSAIVAAYPVSAFVSGLITAFYVDRFDRKKVLLFAYSGFLIGTVCCGLAPDEYLLMAARILTGLFGGLIGAQVLSIVADTFPYEKRGRAMGTIFMAFSVASVFGVPFSLYLAKLVSWHAPFIFIGIVGILIIPLIIAFLPPMTSHMAPGESRTNGRPDVAKVITGMLKNKSQVLALLLSGSLMMGHFLIIPFLNPYMEFNVGFTKDQTPLIYMVGGICALITSPIIGRWADKHGKLRVFVICLFLSLIPIFLITNMPSIPFYYVLCVMGFWFTFSTGRNIPAQAMISSVVNPAERGQFMSFNSSFQQLFTGMASIIAGLIVVRDDADGKIYHYNWVGYLSIAIVFSTVFIARTLARRQALD